MLHVFSMLHDAYNQIITMIKSMFHEVQTTIKFIRTISTVPATITLSPAVYTFPTAAGEFSNSTNWKYNIWRYHMIEKHADLQSLLVCRAYFILIIFSGELSLHREYTVSLIDATCLLLCAQWPRGIAVPLHYLWSPAPGCCMSCHPSG